MSHLRRVLLALATSLICGPSVASAGHLRVINLQADQPSRPGRFRGAGKPGTPGAKLARRALSGRLGLAAIR